MGVFFLKLWCVSRARRGHRPSPSSLREAPLPMSRRQTSPQVAPSTQQKVRHDISTMISSRGSTPWWLRAAISRCSSVFAPLVRASRILAQRTFPHGSAAARYDAARCLIPLAHPLSSVVTPRSRPDRALNPLFEATFPQGCVGVSCNHPWCNCVGDPSRLNPSYWEGVSRSA
jgi:hypothetical protein